MKTFDEIISLISNFSNFDALNDSIDVYIWIKDNSNIKNTAIYKHVFTSFYGLNNAGLGDNILNEYFILLNNADNNLNSVIRKIFNTPNLKNQNSIQFSFATKLIHTLDDSKPIYDSEISNILGIKLNISYCKKNESDENIKQNNLNKNLEKINEKYSELEEYYKKILSESNVIKKINEFKNHNNKCNKLSNVKILDFILWYEGKKLSKLKNNK